jgi:CheY-like chemotaxis protein
MASILIVEDIPAVLLSLKLVLRGAGHRITCAENGACALDLLKTEAFSSSPTFGCPARTGLM